MLRILSSVTLATVLVVSCGSDDDKRSVRAEDAGAGGEAGEASDPNAGGSSMSAAGQGGAEPTAAGAAGVPATAGGAGGAPVAGAGGSSAAGETGSAGAAGASGEPISLFCTEPGEYYSGEGGCLACEGEPEPQTVTCVEAFYAKDVEASGGPNLIVLAPSTAPREALPVKVTVTYQLADSVEQLETDMTFDFNAFYWEIDVGGVPQSATQMRVQPFSVPALCGDTFTLTDEVIFVTGGGDDWAATCPGQT
jgi:hypothetical protein